MDNKLRNKQQGFTLVEFIIVIALVVILAIMTVSYSFNFYRNTVLQEDSEYVLNALRRARSNALTSKEDSDWGVIFFEDDGRYIIFKGDIYENRDASFDIEFEIYSDFNLDFQEIVFEKDTGNPKVYESQ